MSSLSLSTRTWISTVFRFVLAGVWLYAGAIKLTQPGGAREAVIAYRIFPASWVDFLGWALPGQHLSPVRCCSPPLSSVSQVCGSGVTRSTVDASAVAGTLLNQARPGATPASYCAMRSSRAWPAGSRGGHTRSFPLTAALRLSKKSTNQPRCPSNEFCNPRCQRSKPCHGVNRNER